MSLSFIDHIAVETSDVEKAVQWYAQNFKCQIKYQDRTWAMILFDNISLALVTPGQHPPHFAVVDSSVKENENSKMHRDGIYYLYDHDVDNNVIEKIHRKS